MPKKGRIRRISNRKKHRARLNPSTKSARQRKARNFVLRERTHDCAWVSNHIRSHAHNQGRQYLLLSPPKPNQREWISFKLLSISAWTSSTMKTKLHSPAGSCAVKLTYFFLSYNNLVLHSPQFVSIVICPWRGNWGTSNEALFQLRSPLR